MTRVIRNPMTRVIETHNLNWNGIAIMITWEPNWLNLTSGIDMAHLEVETVSPAKAALPITETGYLSHFTAPATVETFGGPKAYVEAWLETESQAPDWRKADLEQRQHSLF